MGRTAPPPGVRRRARDRPPAAPPCDVSSQVVTPSTGDRHRRGARGPASGCPRGAAGLGCHVTPAVELAGGAGSGVDGLGGTAFLGVSVAQAAVGPEVVGGHLRGDRDARRGEACERFCAVWSIRKRRQFVARRIQRSVARSMNTFAQPDNVVTGDTLLDGE